MVQAAGTVSHLAIPQWDYASHNNFQGEMQGEEAKDARSGENPSMSGRKCEYQLVLWESFNPPRPTAQCPLSAWRI